VRRSGPLAAAYARRGDRRSDPRIAQLHSRDRPREAAPIPGERLSDEIVGIGARQVRASDGVPCEGYRPAAPEVAVYRNPTPTVDVVVELPGGVVLIARRHEPLGWALPGGFVDEGETVEHAAVREVREETGLDVTLRALLHVYSDPARDPRQHTMSTVFFGTATGAPQGSDDAADAGVFALDALPSPLAFDHAKILADYARFKATGRRPLE